MFQYPSGIGVSTSWTAWWFLYSIQTEKSHILGYGTNCWTASEELARSSKSDLMTMYSGCHSQLLQQVPAFSLGIIKTQKWFSHFVSPTKMSIVQLPPEVTISVRVCQAASTMPQPSLQLDPSFESDHSGNSRHRLSLRRSWLLQRQWSVKLFRLPRFWGNGLCERAPCEELRPARVRGFSNEALWSVVSSVTATNGRRYPVLVRLLSSGWQV